MSTFQQKHGRPKPPKINSEAHIDYCYEHETYAVLKDPKDGRWYAFAPGGYVNQSNTHAEAITWAQKQAHNRNGSGGEVSGA